jgi:nucleotide-binding universal stress UspA family protein
MFDHILVPVDRSPLAECVLPHVVALAGVFESHVTLVHVMDSRNLGGQSRAVDPLDWQIRTAEAENYLHDLALRLQQTRLKAERHLLEGQSAERIVEFAHHHDAGLIVMSSHGQSGLSAWNVSSVVQKIFMRAATSMMIVRAQQPASPELSGLRYRRLFVPLDGSQRAECVLPQVAMLARAHQAQIVLAHVVRRPEMPRRMPPTRSDVELADQLVERNRAEAVEYLEQIATRLPGDVQTRVVDGEHVVAALHALIDQEQIDLVFLSAHGYSGVTRWPYGSTTVSFVIYGTTPLLIVQDAPWDRSQSAPAETAAKAHERWEALPRGE